MSTSGLVVGTSGNVSARTPDGNVLVTPSGLDYAILEPEDVVLVDLDGKMLEGSFEPSVETPMHTGIYRARPEAGGIVHTHSRYSTTLACLNWEILPIHYMLAVLSEEGRVPIAEYATIAIGASVSEAYARTELLEEMAEIYYRARVAGEPVLLTPEQIAEVSAKIHDYGQSKPSPAEIE
jgi:L-fuculose-phosphate aldolase